MTPINKKIESKAANALSSCDIRGLRRLWFSSVTWFFYSMHWKINIDTMDSHDAG